MAEATACARTIVAALLAGGVTEAVLAPGSRSAPLAYALEEADRTGRLRLHVRVDERTAAFLALGLAKASERPVPVVTTSGTAAANLHPAVLEAAHSHLPLVLVTASRPRALVHTGANQTTDQHGLFGSGVRAAAGLSDAVPDSPTWRFEVGRLLTAATGRRTRWPGPVHLNVELGEPLLPPDTPPSPEALPSWLDAPTRSVAGVRPAEPLLLAPDPATVVVAGDLPPAAGRAVAEQAAAAGVPLLAEPSSNARRGPAAHSTYRLLLGGPLADAVQRVVLFGHPTLSRPVTRLLARPGIELVTVSAYADWVDPARAGGPVVDGIEFAGPGDRAWWRAWQEADDALRPQLDRLLADQTTLTGPALAAALWTALGGRDVLVAGSSNPIRDLDLAPVTPNPPVVFANRGLAGIDGTISTAAGVALATGRPTSALLGDLTAIHDLTGLFLGPAEPRPDLRLVVANDDGGSIFATLEQGGETHRHSFERLFGTPTDADFASLAGAAGVSYRRVDSVAALTDLLAEPASGIELVEAVVDRAGRRALSAAVTGLVARS